MKDAYIITGGKPYSGEVQLSGAKNVALKVIIASLLLDGEVILGNIPYIRDVAELIELTTSLGIKLRRDGHNLTIDSKGFLEKKIDMLSASKIRVSFMLFAPLLYRFGKASIPNPGGCRLGARPIDRQIEMMKAFGVKVIYDSSSGYYHTSLKSKKPQSTHYKFSKPTHTGTELALMFAAIADGSSRIDNAACEPEIDDLVNFLNQSGAKITGKNGCFNIVGVDKLIPGNVFTISNDRNEAPTFAAFAIATKGDVCVKGISKQAIRSFVKRLEEAGGGVEEVRGGIRFFYKRRLLSSNITTRPHPGFMTDWQGPWAVLMTQAKGISTIHETVFENRFGYVSELKKLGARIDFYEPKVRNSNKIYQFNINDRNKECEPQAIRIEGGSTLHGGVLTVSDLRAGASLLIAAACTQGETIINGASVIDRGYEKIDKKLLTLGATIKKV
ncbi:UDP-N-acetylglucosamine 1-carboxyvinyltransferase [Candidatus Roizmanbacteria bacterium RIFCSPHIGHO2_02_FULL_37_13b]|uniref:UDP-N-acetylglucosamine 1-carboxyvinyltransferase n=1 Tax=Candidatus Roizmanbacteria bacterium RIFCSPLOWO2_02_FULL_36_11 TaxID=1802071 RepID=A0A1F7JG77_9BACT|nr:MAG: UDP-N-acetylglucosamine 1-carboxyvinyltransferase [Candidatus Roizmanbacteria bacterium RIFCSPHIGHO2_02_FULL_37_13b]OGK54605.1 MAG: UDP-N-acetylglucosamine 1-carboxyvinyltransferase [Candidatus Roizmanbacteria bacterium RIFCSPLOWO2_02_FULL_36_11]